MFADSLRALRVRRVRLRAHRARPDARAAGTSSGPIELGRDYLSRVIFGLRTSLWVALFVGRDRDLLGTIVGAISGYYGGGGQPAHALRRSAPRRPVPRCPARPLRVPRSGQAVPGRVHSRAPDLARPRTHRPRGRSSHSGRRSSSRRRRRPGRAICASCSATCCRARSDRSSSRLTLLIAAAILIEAALSFLGFGVQPPDAGAREAHRRRPGVRASPPGGS